MKFQVDFSWYLIFSSVQAWSFISRLGRDVIPKSYSLKLVPDIQNDVYTGEVIILMGITRSMNNITLNSRNLILTEITLDQAFERTEFHLDPDTELLHVFYTDQDNIHPGEHMLNIKFNGSLKGSFGFYSIKFRDGRRVRNLLATKFSAINARSAFPCFDEPYFKSVFSIRLVKPDDSWTALSNMRDIGHFNTSQGIAVDFQSTLPISTYLLTWILTDLTYEEIDYNRYGNNIPLRFFTSEKRAKDRRKALEITRKALIFFERYTDIVYPLSKLDSIEVPFYRSRGMEHWGLIVYQANSVTHNPDSFSSQLYHLIDATMLITHEVSHMWFGNLVTHEWYTDLWLTEGLARFMQYKASLSIIEEPFVEVMFQNNKLLSLFQMNCGKGASIETASCTRTMDDIIKKFGPVSYDQGAAILLMLEDVIGPEKLQQVLRSHLKQYQYKHATTADFMRSVENEVPTINVRNFMETYLYQRKLPLITVTENIDCYILKQEPFCSKGEKSIFGNKWTIPIKYTTSSNKTSRIVWFDRDMINVTIPKHKNDRWIKLNHLNSGLYHSLYTGKIYNTIGEDFKNLDIQDRGFILEEAFLLASHSKITCDIALNLISGLRTIKDLDFLTFTYASRSYSIFMRTSNFEQNVVDILKLYFIYIFEVHYHDVSWIVEKNETIDHRLLRMGILESFCLYNLKYIGCYRDANFIKSHNISVHNDIQYIYKAVMRSMYSTVKKTLKPPTQIPLSPRVKLSENVNECADWIIENIPKIISETSVPIFLK